MITLLGALVGFVSSAVPEAMKLYQDHKDKKHELAILQTQMKWHKSEHTQRIDEIELLGHTTQMQAIYKSAGPTNVKWVDALAGTVRPLVTYAFFIIYGLVKVGQWQGVVQFGSIDSALEALVHIWTEEDQALFAAVMSFWFGQRALIKRQGR